MDSSLTLVVPAYNEAVSLEANLPEWIRYCHERGWQIIVVNDGSQDPTRQVLEKFSEGEGFQVLHHKVNRGYGGALKTGLAQARTRYVVTIDADGQHHLCDVDRLLAAIQEQNADMVIGRRTLPPQRALQGRYRELGKWIIRRVASLLMPLPIRDLNSGFKLYETRIVQHYLHLCPNSMAFSDIIALIFISQRHLVIELPVEVQERRAGKSTIGTRTAFETVYEILNIIMLFNPMKIFLPASLLCIGLGLAWGIPIVLLGRGVSVGSMLAIVTGIIFFFLGLVAEQLSLIRKQSFAQREDGNSNSPTQPGQKTR